VSPVNFGPIHAASAGKTSALLKGEPLSRPVAECPFAPKEDGGDTGGSASGTSAPGSDQPLEYCDIHSLSVTLQQDRKAQTIVVDRDRKSDPVHPKTNSDYLGFLSGHDLVIEALADIADVDGLAEPGQGPYSASSKPLVVTLQAINDLVHSTFSPPHPRTTASVAGGVDQISHGGQRVTATYVADGWSPASSFNPFWRSRDQDLVGEACGNRPIPQVAQHRRSAKLVVLPYEELTIALGVAPRWAGGYKKTGTTWGHEQDGKSGRKIKSVTETFKKKGDEIITNTKTAMFTQSGIQRLRETDKRTHLTPRFLGSEAEVVENQKESWNKRRKKETSSEVESEKIVIKRKVGGIERSGDIGKLQKEARNLWRKHEEMKERFDELKKAFTSVKIGWSFSANYEILSGEFRATLGNRWPASFVEDHRVYYVERYVRVGGEVQLIKGEIGAFFGFAVDPWYLPVAVEIGGYVNVSAGISVSGDFDTSWTGPSSTLSNKVEFTGTGKIEFEPGLKANGRAFGYAVQSRLALEAEAVLTARAEFGDDTPIYCEWSCRIGKEATKEGDPPVGLRLVGEIIFTGDSVRSYKLTPCTLIEGTQIAKDEPLIGTKPKDTGTWQKVPGSGAS
jgi:hypothetical protein